MIEVLHFLPIVAFVAYLISSVLYFRLFTLGGVRRESLPKYVLLIGFVFHLGFQILYSRMVIELESFSGFYSQANLISKFSCFLVGIFLLLESRLKLSALGPFVALFGTLLMLFSSVLFHDLAAEESTSSHIVLVHVVALLLSYVFYLFASFVSTLLIFQESLLKKKRFGAIQRKLPSLKTLDRLNLSFLVWGFLAMSCGVVVGMFFLKDQGMNLFVEPSFIVTLITLIFYAVIIVLATNFGLRGRKVAWSSIFGFFLSIFSFLSVHFLFDFHV